ncbi:MAG: type II toxin-antitoxin system HicB family antitoxin [archaeon]
MTYKGYSAVVEFDSDAEIFHGEVIGIRDVVTFQGKSVKELKKAFQDSVDDYLEFCMKKNKEPEKPYSGKFVLRVSPELHKNIALSAKRSGKSINNFVKEQLEKMVRL